MRKAGEHLRKLADLDVRIGRNRIAVTIELQRAVDLLSRTLEQQRLVSDLGKDVLQVITDYAYALATLDRYDHGTLAVEETSGPASFLLEYDEAISVVQSMKTDFDGLFGL